MGRRPVLLSYIVLMMCAAACIRGDRNVESPMAIPAQFSKTGGEKAVPSRWWKSFGDPQLDQLIETGVRDNLSIRASWHRLREAAAAAQIAGSERWPSLDATASANRLFGRGSQVGVFFQSGTRYSIGLSASYEIDLWGRVSSATRAAELDAQATAFDVRSAAMTLTAEIATTYYELLELRARRRLLEEQLATNETILELVKGRFRRGIATSRDALAQEQLAESSREELLRTELEREIAIHRLNALLGRAPASALTMPIGAISEVPTLPNAGLPAELIQRRPDVLAAFMRVRAANERVASAIAERFPRLSLSGSITSSQRDPSELFSGWLANLGANLLGPLIDGRRRRAQVDRSRAEARRLLDDYGTAVLTALTEVEDALARDRAQAAITASLERQGELAERALERAKSNFINGTDDYLAVLDATRTSQDLQRRVLTAQRDQLLRRVELCRALAGSWHEEDSPPKMKPRS